MKRGKPEHIDIGRIGLAVNHDIEPPVMKLGARDLAENQVDGIAGIRNSELYSSVPELMSSV